MAQSFSTIGTAKRSSRLGRRNNLIAYSFLLPNFLGFAIFTLVPVLFSVVLSFMDWNGGPLQNAQWAGLNNYASIFKNFGINRSDLGITLKNTLLFTLATVPLTIICSLTLAMVLNKAARGAKLLRAIFFFPYVASLVAICVCWSFMLMKTGPVNQVLAVLGINISKSWTQSKDFALWSIIIVSVWRSAGYYMVMYLAGLQGVPSELYEAATVDGASAWQRFWRITFPMLTPTTFFVSIMMIISCFKIYDVVAIMTEGGPGRATKMLVTYIYDLSFNQIKYGLASAVSMVLLVIVLAVTIIQFRGEKKWVNYM